MMQSAERLSSILVAKSYIKSEEQHIYSYCFEVIFSGLAFWGSMLIFALLTNTLLPTALYLFSFLFFRHTAGGYHASTHTRCFLMSAFCFVLFFGLISFMPENLYPTISSIFLVISYLAFFTLAPIDHENNPFTPEQKQALRHKLLLLMSLFLLFITILWSYHYSALVFYLSCGCFQSGTAIILAEKKKRKEDKCYV